MEKEIKIGSEDTKAKRNGGRAIEVIRTIVASRVFDLVITGVIILQAIVLALEATPSLVIFLSDGNDNNNDDNYSGIAGGAVAGPAAISAAFGAIHAVVVSVFIVEAGMRMAALYPTPQAYFKSGWNNFDFAIIILSVMPVAGQFSTVARLVRLLRVTRLVTKSRELRAIVSTLARSIPSIFNILILLGIFFFIYAIAGYHLFREVDPDHWSSFLTATTTLFQIITLEGWVDVMQPVITELGPLYWLYFASFILIGTFIIINLFISVIVRKSEEAYQQLQRESTIPLSQQEIVEEIREIRRILESLESRMGRGEEEAMRNDNGNNDDNDGGKGGSPPTPPVRS